MESVQSVFFWYWQISDRTNKNSQFDTDSFTALFGNEIGIVLTNQQKTFQLKHIVTQYYLQKLVRKKHQLLKFRGKDYQYLSMGKFAYLIASFPNKFAFILIENL